MNKIAILRFRNNFNKYEFDIDNKDIEINDYVIVKMDNGENIGKVFELIETDEDRSPIVRKADDKDIQNYKNNTIEEKKNIIEVGKVADSLELDMNIIDCNYNLDRTYLTIYFSAAQRIDFRELAKRLGKKYKTKIELMQIGVRDKARLVGGYGPCGQELCCKRFLKDLSGININMAKNQRLALNPSKINGLCGRLMCCLSYENDLYLEKGDKIPFAGSYINYEGQKCKVITSDVLAGTYKILTPDNKVIELDDSAK